MIEKLPNRMEAIISMVSPGMRVCDVGCDHGYVSIALVKRGISPKALAMDINKGPLMKAKEHVAKEGLDDRITLRLSDGLKAYKVGEADSLIIAGMGGPLICEILSENINNTRDFKELILSPQSKIADTRRYLADNGYAIEDEAMVYEDGKYYVIIKALFNDKKACVINETEALLGPVLLNKGSVELKNYIDCLLKKNKDILMGLKNKNESSDGGLRIKELEHEIELLNLGLEHFD